MNDGEFTSQYEPDLEETTSGAAQPVEDYNTPSIGEGTAVSIAAGSLEEQLPIAYGLGKPRWVRQRAKIER